MSDKKIDEKAATNILNALNSAKVSTSANSNKLQGTRLTMDGDDSRGTRFFEHSSKDTRKES